MKRVYTDERFPGYALVNDGSCQFEIRHNDKPLSTFESWEKKGGTISEEFAARVAADVFERNARLEPDLSEALDGIPADRDATAIVNSPPSKAHNSQLIDRMIEREKRETDPELKRRLRHNIMHLMKKEESVAEAVVSQLLEN